MPFARRLSRRQFLQTSLAGSLAAGLGLGAEAPAHDIAVAAAGHLAGSSRPVLRLLLPEGSESNLQPIIDEFDAATGVRIETLTTGVDDINTVLLLDRLTGRSRCDVALPATFGIPDLAEAGALQPLDDYARRYEPAGYQADSLYAIGDFYAGRLYGYQADGDVYLLFYNAAFLEDEKNRAAYADRYGESLGVPGSWQELDRQLQFFHDPAHGRFGGALFRTPRYIAWEWWMRLHSKGAVPFDTDMRPTIAGDAGVAALEELTSATRYLCASSRSNNLFENWQEFSSGRIFCNLGWGGSQKYFRRHSQNFPRGLVFGHAPGNEGRGKQDAMSFFNWGWNYAVPSGSASPELAYLFALYASSPGMSTLAVRQPDGFFDPVRESHYADPEIEQVYSRPFLEAHRQAMRAAVPDLYLRGQGDYFAALSDYVIQADRRMLTPREAMQAVAKLWDETTDRLGRDEQVRQWHALLERYPASLRPRSA